MWEGILCCYGSITISGYKERFLMALNNWTIKEYKKQWREAIKRLETHDISCLIVSAYDLEQDPFLWTWPMYKVGDIVYLQNRLLFDVMRKDPLSPSAYTGVNDQTCYDFMDERETINEKGRLISEWSVPLADVLSFKVV